MAVWIQNIFSSVSSYQDYDWSDYRKYTTAVSNGFEAARSLPKARVPELVQSGFQTAFSCLPEMKIPKIFTPFASAELSLTETLWNHKERIAGIGILSVVAVATAYFLTRKVAQKPTVKWLTTLDKGVLQISTPKTEKTPPNVNISFCIDTSASMEQEDREDSVKAGVKSVINHARGVMKAAGARIDMGAIGFSSNAVEISSPTSITKKGEGEEAMRGLIGRVEAYNSHGGTSIGAGIGASIGQLKTMAKANPAGKNVVILLSDGEDREVVKSVAKIQEQLGSINAEIFTIGIGNGHDKTTLKAIAGKANYIDTTTGVSIEDAIARVYGRAIATFSKMQLQLHGIPETKWSVGRAESKVNLSVLTEEDAGMSVPIQIDSQNLDADLDLGKVSLELTYRDPHGILGRMRFPWNPGSIIRPDVLKA